MADILKISTPLLDKNPIQPNKQVADPSVPFNLSDISKVIKPNQQSEILKQNNGMIQREDAPSILMNMLKDPSVAVGFLKNIFMLEEIIKLLPVNNNTVSQEIQQLFNALLVSPEEIVAELMRQEQSSTSFKGQLFDFLRQMLQSNPKAEMRYGIANLLKSLNAMQSQRNILDSISNTLMFLSDSMKSSKNLSTKLTELAVRFRLNDAPQNFQNLKNQTLEVVRTMQDSILYTPKLQKIVPLLIYNLSRYNDNPDFLREAASSLMTVMDGNMQKERFASLLHEFLTREPQAKTTSQVMDVLAKLIGKQTADAELTLLNSDKIEKIVHSLLSSPCNFTPLLHFIIPVQDDEMKSFAEIWVDPDEEQDSGKDGPGDSIHLMAVFDVDGIGRFEAELYVKGKEIKMSLFCPQAYVREFEGIGAAVSQVTAATGYKIEVLKVEKLERQRSLMDVFKTLPHRRAGIDVTI